MNYWLEIQRQKKIAQDPLVHERPMPVEVWHDDSIGYIMKWTDPESYQAFEYLDFRKGNPLKKGILLADHHRGGFATLEEAIQCLKN